MSIHELLPVVHALPNGEKLQLIRILAEDLAPRGDAPDEHLAGDFPVWTPHGAFEAADGLLSALAAERESPRTNG